MRRIPLIAVVVAGAVMLSAGPAVAKREVKTLVMSTHVTNVRTESKSKSAQLATVQAPTPGTVVHTGYRSECTTPQDQNFYTTNTSEQFGANNTLVSYCYALLWLKLSTTNTLLTWDHTGLQTATVQACRVYVPDNETDTIPGTGTSTTIALGLFLETCTANAPTPSS